MFDGKTILLTGGTGSFGTKFTEIVLDKYKPRALRIYSRSEYLQYEMSKKFEHNPRLRFFLGDVRDYPRLYRAMADADIVVHAAALKQVPWCEYNPDEAVKTNILGAINIIRAANEHRIEKVLAISTDKAVHSVNLYGATKMVAEKLFVQGNVDTKSKFSLVRYGNVVGSRGSVLPVFLKQKESGRFTVTDKRMTRFWLTLSQGVEFAISCVGRMKGGEIFVPKIPSMKIVDLVGAVADTAEVRIKYTGIRAGEKLHECLLTSQEARHACDCGDYYVVLPEHHFWVKKQLELGEPLLDGFEYRSDNNERWLTQDEIRDMIG